MGLARLLLLLLLGPPGGGRLLGQVLRRTLLRVGFFPFFLAPFEASSFGGGDGFVSAVLYSDCSEVLSSVGKITF